MGNGNKQDAVAVAPQGEGNLMGESIMSLPSACLLISSGRAHHGTVTCVLSVAIRETVTLLSELSDDSQLQLIWDYSPWVLSFNPSEGYVLPYSCHDQPVGAAYLLYRTICSAST